MRRDAIMQDFWLFLDSEYAKFLHMQGSEYGWIMPYDRVLIVPGQPFTGFKWASDCKYAKT